MHHQGMNSLTMVPDAFSLPDDTTAPERSSAVIKQDLLEESEIFGGLTDAQMQRVDALTSVTQCERGKVFFSPEDTPGTIYFLKEGRVRLYRRTPEGKQLTIAVLDRGAVFGESRLIGQNHAGVYAEADEHCQLCVMPAGHLEVLIGEVPLVGLNLLRFVGQRLQRTTELAEEVAFWSVRRRLARTILELDERYGHPTLGGGRIVNKTFTQADIAEMCGATRETVAELMSALKKQGILGTRRRRIVIEDREALEALSVSQ
ncbi:MAG: putative transcriptional regulator [Thermoleophilia bacterium]|nr:putative transcriptional regulator [Thermoleophilia bacterium]